MSTYDLQLNARQLRDPFCSENRQQNAAPTLFANLYRGVAQRLVEWRYRRTLASLLNYNDRVLEDIGMMRSDLISALDLPLSINAHQALCLWREERLITG